LSCAVEELEKSAGAAKAEGSAAITVTSAQAASAVVINSKIDFIADLFLRDDSVATTSPTLFYFAL
jgi:translation elongation factor EF-Ts